MQLNNFFLNHPNILRILYVSLFFIFITPYSLVIDNSGVSANYLYIFFPLVAFFINRRITFPPYSVIIFMIILCLIFLYGALYQANQYDLLLRRSASFFVFMAIFAFMFVKIDSFLIQSFKLAIVIWSIYESSFYIVEYINIDGNNQGFYAKGIMGTQRIGFIYLIGFWITIMFNTQKTSLRIIKFLSSYIILVGLFLTFTRAGILALGVSIFAYLIFATIISLKNSKKISIALLKIFSKFLYIFILLILVAVFFRGPIHYYSSGIFNYIFSILVEFSQDKELNLYTSLTVYDRQNKELQDKLIPLIVIKD